LKNAPKDAPTKPTVRTLSSRDVRVPTPSKSLEKKAKTGLWDLDRDGISYSLLSDFQNCRERFRIKVVEGLTSAEFNVPLEFGNAFHICLEHRKESFAQIAKRLSDWAQRKATHKKGLTPQGRSELNKIIQTVLCYWDEYCRYWKSTDDSFRYVYHEDKFSVPYKVNGYRSITLRGKSDGIIEVDGGLWIMEHKTKAGFDQNLLEILPKNIQTCLYAIAMQNKYKRPIEGVLWNGVKRPTIRQTAKDGDFGGYLARLKDDISQRPEFYFHRVECRFDAQDLAHWEQRTLQPLLASLIVWWDSIKANPTQPWVTGEGKPNIHHWERPYGVYDPMSHGLDTYFEYVTQGVKVGLAKLDTVFPELDEE
jgi:hypothetical protein